MLTRSTLATPIGTLQLVANDQILIAAGFGSYADLKDALDPDEGTENITKVDRIPVITDLLEDYLQAISKQ